MKMSTRLSAAHCSYFNSVVSSLLSVFLLVIVVVTIVVAAAANSGSFLPCSCAGSDKSWLRFFQSLSRNYTNVLRLALSALSESNLRDLV